jgi:acyl-coenzyme A synthetase/AMP-(fatty) acid ligase
LQSNPRSLWESITAGGPPAGCLHGVAGRAPLADLAKASSLGGRLEELRGRSVLLAVTDQLTAALAIAELDGVAQRMVLSPPGLAAEHLPAVIAGAAADACVRDAGGSAPGRDLGIGISVDAWARLEPHAVRRTSTHETEWILLTSGTTGAPKLVQHDLASLTAGLADRRPAPDIVWSTMYDIRRYGGLQIYLRALHAGSLVLSDPHESVAAFLARAGAAGVTHISGTPSHWRRVLMSGAAGAIAPRYVRLSGEIADQAVLDGLKAAYPQATVAHVFASTEAGVAFEVRDGRAGFPASLLDAPGAPVHLRVVEGTLRIRSPGNAHGYLGEDARAFPRGSDGAIDTGDRIERRADRGYFLGRQGGVINVGGLKVYPEEIEAVINLHPWVRMSRVRARRNPITGAVVVADVVLAETGDASERPGREALERELIHACRQSLAPYKVPAMIRIVPGLEMSASGKLVRPDA